MKSPVKWPGGKRWLAKKLSRIVAEIKPQLVAEPFCGGASFSFHNQFERVLANDNSQPLINFYRHLRDGLVYDTSQFRHSEDVYYPIRKKLNDLISADDVKSADAARYFYFLNKQGYNGLVRVNRQGRSNVPMGRYNKVHPLIDRELFSSVTEKWEFSSGCYSGLNISKADIAFIDPPYESIDAKKKTFRQYSGTFGTQQQLDLVDWSVDMDIPTIACNNPNLALARYYKRAGFQIYTILAPRSISRKAGGRKPVVEMLALRGFGKSRKFGTLIDGAERWGV